ncbi:sodium-solute symporter, putative [Desulfocucumis palustris]|uniref:Sodium-solute symporter, putative n=1 Tax=Desulfocucumis palustris TaxID=1898651 RepID=A0A2L2XC38_9FIRM|nr:sodium:solute symporter family protein [Desulfocucumis palustris]GBF33662.1 sodium-solute symporter, putative [Desulfocucumis palustris]
MSNQMIQITFLVISIIVLAYIGVLAQKRVKAHEDMSVGGRSFTAWSIFFSLFAFWGGNTIASIVELSHSNGIAGAWFGIARMTMFVLILFITGGAFRKLAMITLSDFISQRFDSPFLRLLSGIIIALNFTIFTVSSVVGASAFFMAILGWSVWASVIFTVASFLVYTTLGGMHALSYNGKILTVGQLLALLVAAVMGIKMAGWANIMQLEPRYFSIMPSFSYLNTTIMWFFTFITNAFVAQAALQIVMSCKTVNEGKKGVIYVALGFVPIIVLAPLVGMAAKVMFPTIKSVQAMPMLASSMPSVVLSTIVVIGLYFTTLGWASSCILSGGTVAANDIYRYFVPNASSEQLIKVSRISIVILAFLTIGFAVLIPSGVEFWTIVGFVLRNTALFPLILIGLFWGLISKKAAITSALAGSITGIAWYLIEFPAFLFGAHPMFVGMIVAIIVVTFGTLWEYRRQIRFASSSTGIIFGLAGCAGAIVSIVLVPALINMKLMAAFICFSLSFLFLAVIFLVKRVEQKEITAN